MPNWGCCVYYPWITYLQIFISQHSLEVKCSTCKHLTPVASCCAQFNWPFEMKASEVVRDVNELSKTNQKLTWVAIVRCIAVSALYLSYLLLWSKTNHFSKNNWTYCITFTQILDVSAADIIREKVKDCQIQILDRCGHAITLERPFKSAKLILQFIQSLPQSGWHLVT